MNYQNTFSDILKVIEKNSTCKRLQVAAIITKRDRIISMGWNGVPAGQTHCCDYFTDEMTERPEYLEHHHDFAIKNEIHAEQNAISFAARNGISTEDTSIYVSISPCVTCAKLIISAGIKFVYYNELYDRCTDGLDLLKKSKIGFGLISDFTGDRQNKQALERQRKHDGN